MKRCVSNTIYEDAGYRTPDSEPADFDPRIRAEGKDWPTVAHTMIGLRRLDNIQFCVEDVIARGVQGDFIEADVWRGGATIFMRAILKAYDITDRIVWVADSFSGLPPPNPLTYPCDEGDQHHSFPLLRVSREAVEEAFRRYGLLDQQVRFIEGWFKDTLPYAPIEKVAVLRLDSDMYESTMDALKHLYHKLSLGGYVIVDDYGAIPACRSAVEDFRREKGITNEVQWIDWTGVYWRRS
jgi:O-methyltransferase